ncbi:MAG: hypothetical protein AAFS12_00095 [Cyanobacteria bacterium J06632_19]
MGRKIKSRDERAIYLRGMDFPDFYAHISPKNFEQRKSDYCLRHGIAHKEFERRSQEEMLKRDWNDSFYPSKPNLSRNDRLKDKLDFLEEKLNHHRGIKSEQRKECPF